MYIARITPWVVDSGGAKTWLFVKLETDDGRRAPPPRLRVGKECGQPVYNLLGGPCRDRIRVYANGWSEGAKTPAELARCATETVDRGFTALKFDPFSNPWRTHIDRAEENLAIERVRAVRHAVGPEVEILVEGHRRLAPDEAIRVAQRLVQFDPFWYEEPIDAEDIQGLAEVRSRTSLPVVTGEALYSKNQFAQVFAQRAADILRASGASDKSVSTPRSRQPPSPATIAALISSVGPSIASPVQGTGSDAPADASI